MAIELDPLPALASWLHRDARDGFEALSVRPLGAGLVLDGHTTGIEEGQAFAVGYRIEVDERWATRRASLRAWWPHGEGAVLVEGDGSGGWAVDGTDRPDLTGIVDVDLESSACTNALPLRRLGLMAAEVGAAVAAPAVYVRAFDLAVERLDQRYERRPDDADGNIVCHYLCERFEADFDLTYDRSGLILDYPGLATRLS